MEATKALYRDLVAVTKDAATNTLSVHSHPFLVEGFTFSQAGGEGPLSPPSHDTVSLFPHANPHSLCLVVVNPLQRLVHAFYHAWVPFW